MTVVPKTSYNPAKPLPNISGLSTPQRLAKIAESQIGYQGVGKNGTGKGDNTVYGAFTGANNQHWCASFVSWCARQASVSKKAVPTNANCKKMSEQSNSYYKWTSTNIKKLKRGDVVFFTNTAGVLGAKGHVGIVTKVSTKKVNGTLKYVITIVEGNTGSDLVKRNTYTCNSSNGYYGGSWKYIGGFISVN